MFFCPPSYQLTAFLVPLLSAPEYKPPTHRYEQLIAGILLRPYVKVVRYSFSGLIPPKFEHKLRRHKQRFGKIAPTVVLDKDENLL